MSLTDRLKMARESMGKGQKEMAQACDASYRMWQAYEVGDNQPSVKVIEALVRLGFNANWLLTGEGEMRRGERVAQPTADTGSALNEDLLSYIVAEVLKRLIGKDKECAAIAKHMAITVIQAYWVCELSPGKTKEEITSKYISMLDYAIDKLKEIAEKKKKDTPMEQGGGISPIEWDF